MHKTLVALALILSTSFATLSDINLSSTTAYAAAAGITLNGAGTDKAGKLVAKAGDFNADGVNDYIVAGDTRIYIVLGKSPARSTVLDLPASVTAVSTDFLLITVSLSGNPVTSVAAAGDINGDGVADIAFGVAASNTAFVVYGKKAGTTWTDWEATGLTVDSTFSGTTGARGIKITGAGALGTSVSAAGDFNKALNADLLVGAPDWSSGSGKTEGAVCVVYGKPLLAVATGTTVALERGKDAVDCTDATTIASKKDGILIVGKDGDKIGTSVALAGDMNGDSNKDVVIGAPTKGVAYIVYGLTATQDTAIDVAATPAGGAALPYTLITGPTGATGTEGFGAAVAGNADFNNDQKNDVAIGFPGFDGANSKDNLGQVYLVFANTPAAGAGKPLEPVDFSAATAPVATKGIVITGPVTNGAFGTAIDLADINNDGIGDLVVGAPMVLASRTAGTGKAYVIYGKSSPATQDLGTTALIQTTGTTLGGITVTGPAGYGFGLSVAASDVTKDDLADVIVGAPSAKTNAGAVYEIRGQKIDTASSTPASGFRLHASLLVLVSFFVALLF